MVEKKCYLYSKAIKKTPVKEKGTELKDRVRHA